MIHIFFNKEYPLGYTTANTFKDAFNVSKTLTEITNGSWYVISGSNHWKTGKPAYYTIYTDKEIPTEVFQTTHLS